MRVLNFGSDYAHERKLQEERKEHADNSTDAATVIPEGLAREMGQLPDNTPEEETEEEQTQEKKETSKRSRKAK